MTRWGRALAALASVVAGVVAACSGGDSTAPNCDAIAAALVTRIEVQPPTATVNLGDSLQLQAVAYSCAGALSDVTTFAWSSGNDGQVTVSPTGLVKAVTSGGAVAVVAAAQGKQGSAAITTRPTPVARVTVEPATASVGIGRTSTLTARAFDAQDRELTGRAVAWSTANQSIVTVTQDGGITGVAAGGPVAVTATIEGQSASSQVTVTTVPVNTVTVQPSTATIAAGQTQQFTATLRDDRGNALTGRAVAWTSSDPTVATINQATGLATGLKPGTTTITATSEGKSGTAQLTVQLGQPTRLRYVQSPPGSVQTGGSLGTVTVEIVDAGGNRLNVTSAVTIAIVSGTGGTLGGTTTVNAVGGLATFTNLTLSALSATNFTLRASSGALFPADASVSVTIPPVTVTTTSLPGGTVNANYNQTLAATGGTGSYTWSIVSGALPAGLSLNAGTGAITGTPNATGTANFTVRATSGGQTDDQALSIVVAAQASNTLTVTVAGSGANGSVTSNPAGINCTLSNGAQGGDCAEAYVTSVNSVTLTATAQSGTTFISWTGCSTTNGTSCTVAMTQARSVSATFAPNLTVTTTTLPAGTVGVPYSQTLAAAGGTPPYTWSLQGGGTLPAGLTLNTSTGVISGTPTAAGTSSFTVRATDTGSRTDNQSLSITVNPAPTATLTVGVSGTGASGTVAATSPSGGVNCTLTAGVQGGDCSEPYTLNTQVTLSASPGVGSTFTGWSGGGCSGTGSCTVTLAAATTVSATFALQSFTLSVNKSGSGSGTVNSTPTGISCGLDCTEGYNVGTQVTLTATPSGGSAFTSWAGGGCTGTGTCVVSMTVATTVTATFTLLPSITTTSLPDGQTTQAYSQTLAATGGTPPYTWSVSAGTLPAGLTLDANSGVVSGTPTATGTSNFTVQVTDAGSRTAAQVLAITVVSGVVAGATQLSFLVQPSNVNAGEAISPPVQVEVLNATGGRVNTSSATVTLAIGRNPGGSTISGATAMTQSGVASFPNVRLSAPGNNYTLVAMAADLVPDTSASFRVR